MRLVEKKLRRVVRKMLLESYEMDRENERRKYVVSLFSDPVEIANVLNDALGKVGVNKRKHEMGGDFVSDKDVLDELMKNGKYYYYGKHMGASKSLSPEHANRIRGYFAKILNSIKVEKKNLTIVDVDDVIEVTGEKGPSSYDEIGL